MNQLENLATHFVLDRSIATLLAALVAILGCLYWRWYSRFSAKNFDGQFYLKSDGRVPNPYSLRWLIPGIARIFGNDIIWHVLSCLSLVISAALIVNLNVTPVQGLFAALLFIGLPGLFRVNVFFPVLIDAPAFMFALASMVSFTHNQTGLGIAFSLLAGASKESAPIFIMCWTLNPLGGIGIFAAGWWKEKAAVDHPAFLTPWTDARQQRKGVMTAQTLLYPWGVVAILFLYYVQASSPIIGLAAGLSLLVGYAQLFRTRDFVRLYQWAYPALIPIVIMVPVRFYPLALGVHYFFNTAKGV